MPAVFNSNANSTTTTRTTRLDQATDMKTNMAPVDDMQQDKEKEQDRDKDKK